MAVGRATNLFPIPNNPEFEYVCTAAGAVSVVVLVLESVIVVSNAELVVSVTVALSLLLVVTPSVKNEAGEGAAGAAATVTPVCTASADGIELRPGKMAPDAVVRIKAWPSGMGILTAVVAADSETAGAAATVTPVWTACAAGMEERPGVMAPIMVVMMNAAPSGTGCEPVAMGMDMLMSDDARPAPHWLT